MAAGEYSFGARILDDGVTFFVVECEPPAAPVELLEYPLANYEGSVVSGWHYAESDARLRIAVAGATQAATEASVRALVADLYRAQQQLKLGYADERYWLARLSGQPRITRRTHGFFEVEVEMRTQTSFAWAFLPSSLGLQTALTLVSGTTYHHLHQPAIGGNLYSRPTITITVVAANGMTQLRIENQTLSPVPALIIDRVFANSDVIVIDSATYSVTVNGVATDYEGQFPLLDPRISATNDIDIQATATSAPNLNMGIAWRDRYGA